MTDFSNVKARLHRLPLRTIIALSSRLGLGWSFGQCLATAWTAAKDRRKARARGIAA